MYCAAEGCAGYAPCKSHSIGYKSQLESPGTLSPKALYEAIKSCPTIARGRFEKFDRIRVEFNQLDFSTATTDEKERIPTEKKFALELGIGYASRSRPFPIDSSVLLTVYDTHSETFVMFKKHKESAIVEVWDEAGVVRSFSYGATKDKKEEFGLPLTDAYMSHAEINNKKQLLFVADEKVNPKSFWHKEKEEVEGGENTQFLQRADWGEGFKGKYSPKIVVLDLFTGMYRVCGGEKSGVTFIQPIWLSASEIVCVKVKSKLKIGLNACYQRRTSLVLFNLIDNSYRNLTSSKSQKKDEGNGSNKGSSVQQSEDEEKGVNSSSSVDLDFSCRSPRVRPGTREIYYLAREAVGTHQMSFRLRCIHADSLKKHTVIDIVHSPHTDNNDSSSGSHNNNSANNNISDNSGKRFPGLYTGNLPSRCFLTSDCLLIVSLWGLKPTLLALNLHTHKILRVTSPLSADRLAACSLLDVSHGRILCAYTTPNTPPEIWTVTMGSSTSDRSLGGGEWIRCYKSSLDLRPIYTAEALDVPTKDGVGAYSTQSLVLRPLFPSSSLSSSSSSSSKLEETRKSPVVLFIHGGPHSATTCDFGDLTSPVLLACEGYTVVCTNYRGSIGYGESALNSLPGHIGSRDVQDVLSGLDAVLCLPQASSSQGVRLAPDPSRVALFGGSHGGFLSAHLTTDPTRLFKAAVMRNPVTDFTTLLSTSDIEDWTAFEVGVGPEKERLECAGGRGLAAFTQGLSAADMETLWLRSPMKNVSVVTTPTLLLLGTDDMRVPPSQGRQWGRQLSGRGVVCKVYEYPENGHALASPFAQAHGNVAALLFLRTHLNSEQK